MKYKLLFVLFFLSGLLMFPKPAYATSPVGAMGNITNTGTVAGWAYDPDSQSTPVTIHVYLDGPYPSGTILGATTANLSKYNANYGFEFSAPQLLDGNSHTIYAYALDNEQTDAPTLLDGSPVAFSAITKTKPTVGAIRFDAWFTAPICRDTQFTRPCNLSPDIQKFGPSEWNYRLPFFSSWNSGNTLTLNGADQNNIDKEIDFAKAAGISYFAFDYYAGEDDAWLQGNVPSLSYGLRDYLASSHKDGLKYALILASLDYDPSSSTWTSDRVPKIVDLVNSPDYQRVAGDRPLIYILGATGLFGTKENAKTAIDFLRQQVQATTGKNPYIVEMGTLVPDDFTYIGLDAISSYLGINVSSNGGPYNQIAASNNDIWNIFAQIGYQQVPVVSAGYDYRPRVSPDQYQNIIWFQNGMPTEIANNLANAISWTGNNPASTEANTIIVYAWNENIEGGWLTPTIYNGDARLEEISKVINGSYFNSPRYKGSDLNNDGKIDLDDYNQLVSDFGKNLDPIPLNSDITADGKVDIYDFNILMTNYGVKSSQTPASSSTPLQSTPAPSPIVTPTPAPVVTFTPTPLGSPLAIGSSDLNNDGQVDASDYAILTYDFGKTGESGFIPSDINGDGVVDIYDFNILISAYQNIDSASSLPSSTPSPASPSPLVTSSPQLSSTPTPVSGPSPSVAYWTKTTKTDQVESCSDYTGKCGTKTITTITGVKIYGLNFGSGPVNVRIIDTNGHTYQGTSSVAQESGFDTATAPYNSLTALGFNTNFNDIDGWNVTVSK